MSFGAERVVERVDERVDERVAGRVDASLAKPEFEVFESFTLAM
jgi:hypothetical protein